MDIRPERFRRLRRRLVPVGSYIVATGPLRPDVANVILPKRRMAFDSRYFLHYFRLTEDSRLLFGGRAEFSRPDPESAAARRGILRDALKRDFPRARGRGDRLRLGRQRRVHARRDAASRPARRHAYYAGGYGGHGIALATHLGGLIATAHRRRADRAPVVRRPLRPDSVVSAAPVVSPDRGAYYRMKDMVLMRQDPMTQLSNRAQLRAIAVERHARPWPRSRFSAGRDRADCARCTRRRAHRGARPRSARAPLVLDRQRRLARSRSAVGRARRLPDGDVKVLVAIADVDAAVPKASPVDRHAAINTTSVYTAAVIFPMLPEKLSTDLTSLVADEDRLAVVIEIVVGADGVVKTSDLYGAMVRNRAKLAYNSVGAWLEQRGPVPAAAAAVAGMDAQLATQDTVAQALGALRHEQGALDFETIELRPTFDGDTVTGLEHDTPNRAKALIENLMIAANGATARFLARTAFPRFVGS